MTGIDISGVQADDVPGGWDFIVVKTTEGNSVVNPRATKQWANAARTTRGLYHYARPHLSDGGTQANVFCNDAVNTRGFSKDHNLWQLDCETGENETVTSAEWRAFIVNFMTVAAPRLGKRGFLYAGWPFIVEHGLFDLLYKYMWWLPDYGHNDGRNYGFLSVAANFRGLVVIHQFTSHGGLDQNSIENPLAYAQTLPVPGQHSTPEYHPALTVAATLRDPATGQVLYGAAPDGSMYCWVKPVVRGLNGDYDFVGREVSRLEFPTPAEKAQGKVVAIVDTNEERYALPKVFKPYPH